MSPRFGVLSVLAVAVTMSLACRQPPATVCNESTCLGCCDSTGTCQLGVHENACGDRGSACAVCGDDQRCFAGACENKAVLPTGSVDSGTPWCGPWNCLGCCSGNQCVTYVEQDAGTCGTGGATCLPCGANDSCNSGVCTPPPCDATTCADGCCDGSGRCVSGPAQSESACGTGGASCAVCSGTDVCQVGACGPKRCDNQTCTGCCVGASCVPYTSQNDASCGAAGASCGACNTGRTCTVGQCVSSVSDPCLVISPDEFDFRTVQVGCSSPTTTFTIWNRCQSNVTVMPMSLGTGSANFELTASLNPQVLSAGASATITFEVRYSPNAASADENTVSISTSEFTQPKTYLVPVKGAGSTSSSNSDSFSVPAKADVYMLIDKSCSMSDFLNPMTQNVPAFLSYAVNSGLSFQFAAHEADDNQGFRSEANNPPILASWMDNPVARFRQRMGGSGGSALESVMKPLINEVLPPLSITTNSGFLRSDASLGVIAYTDAVENSPPTAAYYLALLRSIKGANKPNLLSFSALAPFSVPPTCSSYPLPNGNLLSALADLAGGTKQQLCTTDWQTTMSELGKAAFGLRYRYFLLAAPDLTGSNSLTVEINAQNLPANAGGGFVNWTYDAATNSVTFDPSIAPKPLQTVTFTYNRACIP